MTIIHMLSYLAHIPHSPLLLPQISRSKFRQFKKMHQAVANIGHDIYSRGCDTVLLLSPYPSPIPAHLLNVSPQFEVSFGMYGEFSTKAQIPGDLALAYRIRHELGTEFRIAAITREALDGATGAAALSLGAREARWRLLPVYQEQALTQHLFGFGKKLRDILELSRAKIAVISLGDLSRTSRRNREQGRKLDQAVLRNLVERDATSFLGRSLDEISAYALACMRPLTTVLGMLDGQSYRVEVQNYEQKHGVGMFAARFV